MTALAALLDLVLPRRCVGCGAFAGPLCWRCAPTGALLTADPGGVHVVAAAAYDGAVRAALLAYKERGRRDLAAPLARLLARPIESVAGRAPPARAVLVPVPSARSVAAARGGDHVLRLARRAAALTGLRVASGGLRLARTVRDSSGLDVEQRRANLAGALLARAAPPGFAAVLVDDIVTSGATLREAARALAAAGWPITGAAVVAATPRRFPPAGDAHRAHAQRIGSAQAGGLA